MIGQSNEPLSILGLIGDTFSGKTSYACLDPFNYWWMKQIANTQGTVFEGQIKIAQQPQSQLNERVQFNVPFCLCDRCWYFS